MVKITFSIEHAIILCLLLFPLKAVIAQVVISSPNFEFSQACAGPSFNDYNATFIFTPSTGISPSNQFKIELSGPDGDFTDAVVIATSSAGEITTSPATLNFSLPSDTAGENYRIRVKSTAPVATSSGSANFAAYYKIQDSPFTINNLVSTGAFCSGGSYLLTIDNPGFEDNDSPLNYPNLTYNWYRVTGPATSVFVAEGNSLNVSQEGTFFVETNYGTCTSNSFSNRVTVSEAVSGEANATISSSLGSPFCPDQGMTTLNTIAGLGYQWFLDGNLIPDATDQSYKTDKSGNFSVQVDLGDCQASGSIDIISENFVTTINVSEVNEMEAGESLTIIAETDAQNATFEWFYNDNVIDGENTDTYAATQFGAYKLIVSQTTGCEVSNEFLFEITEIIDMFPEVENIPNVISPNGDTINDTWIIPTQYVTGSNTEVTIFSNQGEIVLQTKDYQNNWPIEALELTSVNQVFYYIINPPTGNAKKGSITIIK